MTHQLCKLGVYLARFDQGFLRFLNRTLNKMGSFSIFSFNTIFKIKPEACFCHKKTMETRMRCYIILHLIWAYTVFQINHLLVSSQDEMVLLSTKNIC